MRTVPMSILAAAIYALNLMAVPAPAELKLAEPTAEQLTAAKEAYDGHREVSHGARTGCRG
jgi:hypothetical protein